MSQIDFFLCENERLKFVQYCLEHNCSIVPNQHYSDDRYVLVHNMEQYKEYCRTTPLLFIVSQKHSIYTLELDHFEDKSNKKYFIKQRHGGPTIDFFSPILGELDNGVVGPGYLGIHPYYYHGKNKFFPEKGIIEMYKNFANHIKLFCQKVKLSKRTFWVGNVTIERVNRGEIKLLHISNNDILKMANGVE